MTNPGLPPTERFYINGRWQTPEGSARMEVINPATQSPITSLALGTPADVNKAVAAAKAAFPGFSQTSVRERLGWLTKINDALIARNDEMADLITLEMGAPRALSHEAQAPSGPQHFGEIIRVLESYSFEQTLGTTLVRREAIGVCALITPWNWPLNQIATKVAPAIAAGCTMVLKPSELAPLSAALLAEIIHEAGLPKGVFNLVQGDGQGVGAPLTAHPDIDMISFTGSTRAGIAISETAAPDIKRVALELGGKSAAILLDDADMQSAITSIMRGTMANSGQSCNAITRILVPRQVFDQCAEFGREAASALRVGDPTSPETDIGPIANKAQYERVRHHISRAASKGTPILCGGLATDAPSPGYFVCPTVFGPVQPRDPIAVEEVFGPVAAMIPYDSLDEAISIANDSEYGLSGAVWSSDTKRAVQVAAHLRTGMVHINGASLDSSAPFGGYKKSGNGREWGEHGLIEFLETKSVYGGAQL